MVQRLSVRELRELSARNQLRDVVPFAALVQQPPDELRRRAALQQPRTVVLAGKPQLARHALALVLGFQDMHVYPVGAGPDRLESIGRAPENDIVVEDPSVSSAHGELAWQSGPGVVAIRDLGSTNGTFINGAQVGDQYAILSDGEVLSVGDAAFVYVTIDSLEGLLRMGGS
ncbi:MAG: FHA domain-containing protein [Myxococcus sp.]|nr:FHA domain-containing protein [Myxococcus sp.]